VIPLVSPQDKKIIMSVVLPLGGGLIESACMRAGENVLRRGGEVGRRHAKKKTPKSAQMVKIPRTGLIPFKKGKKRTPCEEKTVTGSGGSLGGASTVG